MREIKLNDRFQEVSICGNNYIIDINDFASVNVLTRFKEEYVSPKADDKMLDDCKHVIDTILGEGTYQKLFNGKKTMKAYLLVNELANIYLDLFMKEEREQQEAKTKEEIEQISQFLNNFDKFSKTLQYAGNKYGMRQHVSGNTSKKYKNRRN